MGQGFGSELWIKPDARAHQGIPTLTAATDHRARTITGDTGKNQLGVQGSYHSYTSLPAAYYQLPR